MMADESPVPVAPIGPPAAAELSRPVPLFQTAWIFLRIGATAFGGLGAAMAMIEREFVDVRRLLSREDLAEALAATRLLPGPAVVQVVAYVGFVLGGWPGSSVATVAFLAPSVLAMLGLAAGYGPATASPAAGPALGGLAAAVVGLIVATGFRIARSTLRGPRETGLALVAFAAGAGWGVNVAAIVVVAGLVGVPLLRATEGKSQ
jgi:chromate transporter